MTKKLKFRYFARYTMSWSTTNKKNKKNKMMDLTSQTNQTYQNPQIVISYNNGEKYAFADKEFAANFDNIGLIIDFEFGIPKKNQIILWNNEIITPDNFDVETMEELSVIYSENGLNDSNISDKKISSLKKIELIYGLLEIQSPIRFCALIDTGAPTNLIPKSVFDKLGLSFTSYNRINISGIGNSKIIGQTDISVKAFDENAKIFRTLIISLHVCESNISEEIGDLVILGMSFLKYFSINFQEKTMSMGNLKLKFLSHSEKENLERIQVLNDPAKTNGINENCCRPIIFSCPHNNHIYTQIVINGCFVDALIDTGAEANLIDGHIYRKIGIKEDDIREFQVGGIGNPSNTKFQIIEFIFNNIKHIMSFGIYDFRGNGPKILLGIDFLEDKILDFPNNKIICPDGSTMEIKSVPRESISFSRIANFKEQSMAYKIIKNICSNPEEMKYRRVNILAIRSKNVEDILKSIGFEERCIDNKQKLCFDGKIEELKNSKIFFDLFH